MVLNELKNTLVCRMPTNHIAVVHFIAINTVSMLIFVSIVSMRWVKIYDGNYSFVLQ